MDILESKCINNFKYIEKLRNGSNLLGFSGGSDSVALFYALVAQDVAFDIAIVDYGVRAQSKSEVSYAKQLAKAHNKKCFVSLAPSFESNFECLARNFRYEFFENLIHTHHYTHLILAHHFNDRFEWFLMQLSKGVGMRNLLGFNGIEKREGYEIIRPMLWITKSEILRFCKECDLKFFIDESNTDERIARNFIRAHFSDAFVQRFSAGLVRSFEILQEEKELFFACENKDYGAFIVYAPTNEIQALDCIDVYCKKMGYMISSKQRKEILKRHFDCEIGGGKSNKKGFIIAKCNDKLIIAKQNHQCKPNQHNPNQSSLQSNLQAQSSPKLPNDFKDLMRQHKIPPRLRGVFYRYILAQNLSFVEFLRILSL
ncbi:tRNA lysidine(34) synthetase TilS [Helicobacter fennelliae]|uniref:tRNA(Ile)-lysidine synthase n=1 Tax=Helicobacter fennelliae TaxID=215 RepID=A0A2X3BIB0_9HELI|nr:tRNA lysidine(34) synthetase TilS [Helicobacter fennelliae]SQB99036.1 tRNA(Ile)-lysidine synthase [Helicobacter fennelliae]